MNASELIERASAAGAKITTQRRYICLALENSDDHPDIETLHSRARKLDSRLSISACYRTMRAFEKLGLVRSHDFGDGRARYEIATADHHDHLIDTSTGKVIQFHDPELERIKKRIAKRLGYCLESHSLELYGRPDR